MAKFKNKPGPAYRCRKPDMLVAKDRERRIDRVRLLERLAEQEMACGHDRIAAAATTTTAGQPSGETKDH